MTDYVKQIRIVHLSDIHFGDFHKFAPPLTPTGDPAAARGRVTLMDSLRNDWSSSDWSSSEWTSGDPNYPLIVALTGDLTEKIDYEQREQVKAFVSNLYEKPILGTTISTNNIFAIPGNHDVLFTANDIGKRWEPYSLLYQDLFSVQVSAKNPHLLSRVRDYSKDLGIIVVELNSCVYITKDSPDEYRGQIDDESLIKVRSELSNIPPEVLSKSIRIAMVHHHPVVLPMLAEPKRGYDAIINADKLLSILQDFGFHLILHGHKHYPHTFSYDAVSAWTEEPVQPMMVVAGGSVGSTQLPEKPGAYNTYNMIIVKWHPEAKQARIRVVTRALFTSDSKGREGFSADWQWKTLRVDDRRLSPLHSVPLPGPVSQQLFNQGEGQVSERERIAVYENLRGNMPVVEVIPSLAPDQAYEARVWIAEHTTRTNADIPTEVIWSAGQRFEQMAACQYNDNPTFAASFDYWGPMLIQARMRFSDGALAAGYVYARIPKSYKRGT